MCIRDRIIFSALYELLELSEVTDDIVELSESDIIKSWIVRLLIVELHIVELSIVELSIVELQILESDIEDPPWTVVPRFIFEFVTDDPPWTNELLQTVALSMLALSTVEREQT